MMPIATSTFEVSGWEESPYTAPEGGPRLAQATVTKVFRGAMEGVSSARLLLCQDDPDDHSAGAGYVASERFEGSLDGRSGSFVLQHNGVVAEDGTRRTSGHVVPGSARGALKNLTGEMEISVDDRGVHTLRLDYQLL